MTAAETQARKRRIGADRGACIIIRLADRRLSGASGPRNVSDLARALGVSDATMHKYLTGERVLRHEGDGRPAKVTIESIERALQ